MTLRGASHSLRSTVSFFLISFDRILLISIQYLPDLKDLAGASKIKIVDPCSILTNIKKVFDTPLSDLPKVTS